MSSFAGISAASALDGAEPDAWQARCHSRPVVRAFIMAAGLGIVAALGGTTLTPTPRAHAGLAVIHYLYDDLDRLVGVVDQQGNVATYTYDAEGNATEDRRAYHFAGVRGEAGACTPKTPHSSRGPSRS